MLDKMHTCLPGHSKCDQYADINAGIKCILPLLHADKDSLQSSCNRVPVVAGGLDRRRRIMEREKETLENDKLQELLTTLYKGLKEEVFHEDTVTAVFYTKTILHLPSIVLKLKDQQNGGYIKVAATEFTVHSLDIILMDQYKEFLQRLEKVTEHYSRYELGELDPETIIKQFIIPKGNLFCGIEMIIQAISVSCVKVSCESVLESLLSIFENHFDARRHMNEDSTSEEFTIAVNGPNLSHCDNLVKEAMDSYWGSKGSS